MATAAIGLLHTLQAADSTALPDLAPVKLVNEALLVNPGLLALRAKLEAMQERPAQAGTLPNPMFTYRGMDTTRSGSFPDTNERRFELEQSFPWFGKRSLRSDIASKDAEAMKSEYDALARDVIMMVKESYYELYAVQKAISITSAEEGLLKQISEIAGTKYATGTGEQQDLLKSQSEITMISQRLLELAARETTATARLNTILDRDPGANLGRATKAPSLEVSDAVASFIDLAQKERPEITGAKVQVERGEIERKLMRKEYLPDMKVGAEYRSFNDGSDDMAMFMVGIEIPVWQGKYRAGTKEADRMIESSKAALEATRKQTAFEVKDSHFKVLTAKRMLNLYTTTLIPQAEMRFKASEAAYRTGKADFMDLLESERFLLNAKVMQAMAEGDLGMQLARLERAIGTDLITSPKHNEVQDAK